MPTAIVNSTNHVIGTKTQPIKSRKIPIRYPYIIFYSVEHKSRECPKKIEVQNMFKSKPISF